MGYLAFTFGLLGNIVSFMVFLAPVPTFIQIYKKKSTQGFQSVPYVVGLFSAILWIYYAFLKPDTTLLVTINSVGCFVQSVYISLFLFYAPKTARLQTVGLIFGLNVVGLGLIVVLTQFLTHGTTRGDVVGWICLVFSLCVFVAPLGVVRQVIRTKSVEYMPFLLSFFLTLSAVMWFFYGLLRKDYNIAIPNVLGFIFGVIQMGLYVMYKNNTKKVKVQQQQEAPPPPPIVEVEEIKEDAAAGEIKEQMLDVVALEALVCSINPLVPAAVIEDLMINLQQEGGHKPPEIQINHTHVIEVSA